MKKEPMSLISVRIPECLKKKAFEKLESQRFTMTDFIILSLENYCEMGKMPFKIDLEKFLKRGKAGLA